MDISTSCTPVVSPTNSETSEGTVQTNSTSLLQLLQHNPVLERITRHLGVGSQQALLRALPGYADLAWPYLRPLQVTVDHNLSQYSRTHAPKGRFISSLQIRPEDLTSDAGRQTCEAWMECNREKLTDKFRCITKDTGSAADPERILRLARGSQESPTTTAPKSVTVQCRDGDIAYAFQRYAIAWTHLLKSANQKAQSSGGDKPDPDTQDVDAEGNDQSYGERSRQEPWLVFEGCVSDNGSPPAHSDSQTRMPLPIRVPKVLWKLRLTDQGGLFDPMVWDPERPELDQRPGKLPLTASSLLCLAGDVIKEEQGQLIITYDDSGSAGATHTGSEGSGQAARDFCHLQAMFKDLCRKYSTQTMTQFNAQITHPGYADRGIKPSQTDQEHQERIERAVRFVAPDKAREVEQNIRTGQYQCSVRSEPLIQASGQGDQITDD